MNKAARNERLKLFANLLNALAAAFVSVGLIGPLFALFYGLVIVNVSPLPFMLGAVTCSAISAGLHLFGRRILGDIQE